MTVKTRFKVNIENIPLEYQPLVKEEMTRQEISLLGTVILRDKLSRMKQRLLGWWEHRKRFKRQNRKEI